MAKKVLVITDAQNEFITGALGNKECEAAVKNIVAAAESGEYSYFSGSHCFKS